MCLRSSAHKLSKTLGLRSVSSAFHSPQKAVFGCKLISVFNGKVKIFIFLELFVKRRVSRSNSRIEIQP